MTDYRVQRGLGPGFRFQRAGSPVSSFWFHVHIYFVPLSQGDKVAEYLKLETRK